MWIRSQTKNALVNINFIRIINDGNYCLICGATIYGYDYELGFYSTEEKAMKVLDMIQNAITGTRFEFTDIVRDCDLAGIEIHNVFKMPKDEEVE